MGRVRTKVTLIRATHESEELIASAAKLCYAHNTERIFHSDSNNAGEFVQKLMRMGHASPVEHAVFTFFVEGVSRAMTHQLVRHRLASYSQRSQRYVDHDGFDYIVPSQFEGKTVEIDGEQVDAVSYFEQTMAMIAERYDKLKDAIRSKGEESNEEARYVLPNACETKILVTMNARELLHFFEERLCMRAQWEIRELADEMLRLIKEVCPALFGGVGPKCVRLRSCPEGPKSCGTYEQIRKRYTGAS
ncbi:MAG: FAD-dependent thymidylate synthase [Planctomycetota bacterium]|nr:FAD-dependent thymidylate synthase [Planctomycetota bacterium]